MEYARSRARRRPRAHRGRRRRDLRAQIASLERELANTLAATYPRVAATRTIAHGGPRLLDLGQLERTRDTLAANVSDVRRRAEDQRRAQAEARARLEAMYTDLAGHKGEQIAMPSSASRLHRLRGPAAARARRPVHQLVAGDGVVGLSVTPHKGKRRRRPKSTAPPVPPRAPKRSLADRIDARPKAPWHPFPLVELAVLVGIVCIAVGLFTRDDAYGRTLIALGLALGALGGLDTTVREHFSGFSSHTLVLAAFPAVAIAVVFAIAGGPLFLVPPLMLVVFALAFAGLRRVWNRTRNRSPA